MNKNIKKLFNLIMYFSTLSVNMNSTFGEGLMKISIPIKISFTRKNLTKTFNFHFQVKQSRYKRSSLYCSMQFRKRYVVQLYECSNQYERSIYNTRSLDVVLQNAYICDEWSTPGFDKKRIPDITNKGINFLNLGEEEYFQYSILYNIPEYEVMKKYRECIDVTQNFYNKYKKKNSNNDNTFNRLMFFDCKRLFVNYINDDIDVSFDLPLDESYYKDLICGSDFDINELHTIIEG